MPSKDKVDIFIPIYIGDYLKDTTFLTTEQHGAYILMLFACWQHGGIPNNDNVICRTTGLSLDAWSNAKVMLLKYFEDDNGILVNRRIEKELLKARKNKNSAVERAKKAANARWKDHEPSSMPQALPQALPEGVLESCPSPSPSTSPETLPTPKPKPSKRFVPPSNDEAYQYMLSRNILSDPIIESEKFVDHFKSNGWKVGGKAPMKDWKAAIRNWEKTSNQMSKSAPRSASEIDDMFKQLNLKERK